MKGRNSDPPDGVEVVELPPGTTIETKPMGAGTVVVAKFPGPDPFLHPARLAALLDETDAAFSSHPLRLAVGLPEAITAGAEVSASLFSVDDLSRETLAIARPQRRDADILPLTLLGERLTQSTADLLSATLARVKERYRLELADGLAFLLRLVLESNGFIRRALHRRPKWEDLYRLAHDRAGGRLPEGSVVRCPHEDAVLTLDDALGQWREIEQHPLDDLVRSPDGSGERASYLTIPRCWWPIDDSAETPSMPQSAVERTPESGSARVYSVKDAWRQLRETGMSDLTYEAFKNWRRHAKVHKPRNWLRRAIVAAWSDDLGGFAAEAVDLVCTQMKTEIEDLAAKCQVTHAEAKGMISDERAW